MKYQRATHTSQCPHPLSWRLLEIGFDVQIIRSHYEACNLAGSWRLRKNLPFYSPVEASMKINAFSYSETVKHLDDAPLESRSAYHFRGARPELDATYAFGHAYNHFHRYPFLLRSRLQWSRYHRIPRTTDPVDRTDCERHSGTQLAQTGKRSPSHPRRVRRIYFCWAP